MVRETTRRVVCSSNIRQIGLGLAMYADEHGGALPTSIHTQITGGNEAPVQLMMAVHVSNPEYTGWDALGWLFINEYLETPGVFYCPSHRGLHPQSAYASLWKSPESNLIFCNYQYRYLDSNGAPIRLFEVPSMAVVTDGMLTSADFNHRVGSNVLWNDLSASWFSDAAGSIAASLPSTATQDDAPDLVTDAWRTLDLNVNDR
ncbi:MAG: DUF1559 domain-containing protein [Phycisphaerales bacterium]|nr:DUF1559 domain-containing protein [Phycisphaerales bacterium]